MNRGPNPSQDLRATGRSKKLNFLLKSFWVFLRLAGLREVGRKNLLSLEVLHERWQMPTLPEDFSGLRILHISDLHIDLCPEVVDGVIERVSSLDYDITVMTGDYQDGVGDEAMRLAQMGLTRLRKAIGGDIYFILGNHDDPCLQIWADKEGFIGLHDRGVFLSRNGRRIFLGGLVDNSRDCAPSEIGVSGFVNIFSILLSHSPLNAGVAAQSDFDFFLTGHTHGGQICLPRGWPLWGACRAGRPLWAGRWEVGLMKGYTSRGVGGSGLPVRFNCPPEIAVHHLISKKSMGDKV